MKKINFTSLYTFGLCLMGMLFSMSLQAQAPAGETEITINLGSGTFNGEISWDLVDVTNGVTLASQAQGAFTPNSSITANVPDLANIEFRAFDSFGDGWNGATLEIVTSEDASANGCAVAVDGDVLVAETVPGGASQTFSFFTGCPACIPDCAGLAPPVLSTDADNCEATVTLANPALTGMCASFTPVFEENFDAGALPAGWTNVATGTNAAAMWMFGENNNTPGGEIDGTGMAFFHDDDFDFDGGEVVQLTSSTIDLSGSAGVTTNLLFDYIFEDIGSSFFLVEYSADGGTTWNTVLNENTDPGCFGFDDAGCSPRSVNFNIPDADLTATFQLRFTYDDGNGWSWYAAVDNIVIESASAAPVATNDSPFGNSTTDASGVYPVGTTTVTFTVQDPNGLPASCTVDITVADLVAPVLDCPADQVFNLDPGACDIVYDYTVGVFENCPPGTVTAVGPYCDPAADPTGGSALACGGGTNSIIQIVDTPMAEGNEISNITFNQESFGTAPNITVNVYAYDGGDVPYTGGAAAPFATATLALNAADDGEAVDVPFAAGQVVPAGVTQVAIEIFTPNGRAVQTAPTCDGNTAAGDLTFIVGPDCGIVTPQNPASIGFLLDASYSITFLESIDAEQTAGLPSGSTFPIGTTVNTFESTDAAGNVGTCSFAVTVNEFANPISTLACNDNVQVSLDEDGCSLVTPDMVLEGGPYGCFEDYNLSRSPAYNGTCAAAPSFAVNAGCEDVGNEFIVTVTDPDTGNSCWSTVTVEDKLAPTIDCGGPFEVAACDGVVPFNPSTTGPAPVMVTANSTDVGGILDSTMDPALATATVAGVPANAVVTNVTISVQATHTWVSDLTIDLIAPDGSEINLSDGACNIGFPPAMGLDVTFDDAGNLPTCTAANTPGFTGTVAPNDPLAQFNGLNANGVWTLRVTDNVGGDVGTLDGFAVNVTAQVPFVPAPIVSDNCGATLTFVDNFFNLDCFDAAGNPDFAGRIERTFTATDASGNSATCVQVINLTRPTLQTIVFPEDITWQCEQFASFPNITEATPLNPAIVDVDAVKPSLNVDPNLSAGILATTGSGVPTINGSPIIIGDLCEIACDFEESTIEVCPGTTKILREWTCIDWCAGESVDFSQIVKVVDELGPDLINPGDYDVDVLAASGAPAGNHTMCEGRPVIPAIEDNGDNCSTIASYTTEVFSISGLDAAGNGIPDELIFTSATNGIDNITGLVNGFAVRLYDDNGAAAQYVVCYSASDECGNETEVCVDVTMFDKVPPVAICDEITTISIGNQNLEGNSCANLAAADLDDGSYDNCTGVNFLVARMIGTNDDPTSGQYVYTPFEEFCCDDIPGPVQVFMLVLDDVAWNIYQNNYGQIQPDGQLGLRGNRLDLTNDDGTPLDMDGRWNFCMVDVLVEDKLPPVVVCPENDKISCDEYADVLESALLAADGDDEAESAALTAAGFGTFTAFDNCGVEVTPTVSISINQCGVGSVVRSFSAVDPSGNGPANCTQVITVYHISDFVVEFPADVDGLCDQATPSFGEPEIFFETCELVATSFEDQVFDVVPDACFKVVRQWTVINWCVVGDNIDQENDEDPENALGLGFPACDLDGDGDCDDRTFRDSWENGIYPGRLASDFPAVSCDNVGNDTDPDVDGWDGFITYQQSIKVQDFDAPVIDPTFDLEDLCIITGNDGTDDDFSDCVFNGVLPTPEYDDCIIDVNGENEDGELIENDVVITTEVFDADGNLVSNSTVLTDLPIGCYVARYTAVDRCGNATATDFDFCIEDCKFPTPYCKDGLVVELMHINDPNNTSFEPMVEVWAVDLDAGSFDNCPGDVQLSFSPNVNEVGVTFNCDNVGENTVELWVTDASGNQDFCETFIVVQANQGQCPTGDPLVAGNIATEGNDNVQDVTVSINNTTGFGATETTAAAGSYAINVPFASDVTITPSKDMNPRNGVTTFDLVTISKHILNIDLLDSPYKMIAADANNSETITTLDLVQIRKLILFIDDEFSNNTSWRFVDADYNFPVATNPWAETFPEVISINDVTVDDLNNNFVGVKIGDVNGTANANELLGADDRSFNGALALNTEDVAMTAGSAYTVEFTAADFNNFGYQFTMNFDANAVEFVEVGNGLATADNFGFSLLEEGVITASYANSEAVRLAADEVVFSLTFAAKADVQLSEVLSITSQYTAAEAYAANGDFQDVTLEFNGAAVSGFELMQNTPNPFTAETVIGFTLAEAKEAVITISDISGKVLEVINVEATKGYNQVTVSRDALLTSGIYYYQLDTDTDSATKKMILID